MNSSEFLGMFVMAAATIISLFVALSKFTQPLNELKIAIQTLNATIENILGDIKKQDERIKVHGKEIDGIHERLTKVETLIALYHKN